MLMAEFIPGNLTRRVATDGRCHTPLHALQICAASPTRSVARTREGRGRASRSFSILMLCVNVT